MFLGDDVEEGHGNPVAEIIHDLAPDAELYLARGVSLNDLYLVIDMFVANGVHLVNRSLGAPLDGPGDGTGPLDALADYAVERGITFINAAGNDGYAQYWRGPWRDDDRDGWLEFARSDERLDVDVSGTGGYLDILGFRWSDWGAPRHEPTTTSSSTKATSSPTRSTGRRTSGPAPTRSSWPE
ncbi:MAG: hypothetical protein R2705_11270 [Ilumatobacteraceae bacterium]